MSHVRLSNGSPTLERMEARQADYPKPSACRSLFGPVDHDELARELQRHRRDLAEASRRKWNFDFQRHQPLDGRYEWRALSHDALPAFYSRPPRLRGDPALSDGGSSSTTRRSHGRAAEEPPRTAVAAPTELGAGPRKRPSPDDDPDGKAPSSLLFCFFSLGAVSLRVSGGLLSNRASAGLDPTLLTP